MIKLNKIKRNCVAAVIITMCLMTAGCARNSTSTTTASGGETTITSGITKEDTDVTHADDAENYRVSITGDFTVTSDTSDGVTQSGSVYTITKAGEYTVAGLLSEGQLIVDAGDEDEVTIVLNGTSITCSSGSPIYVKNASEVKIKSEENSFNEVIDNRTEATEDSSDDAGNAAIYATCDLKLVGKGALVVTGNYNNGIQSKDDLSIKNVIVNVTAVNNAVKGNDAVDIESGNIIAISAKGNGIKTSNSSISNKGNQKGIVTITGGNIDVYAACDGIDAAYGVDISGDGNLNIYTDTYSDYSEEVTSSGSSSGTSTSRDSSANKTASANTVSYVAASDTIANAPGGFGGGNMGGMGGQNGGNAPDMNGSSGGNKAGGDRPGMPGDFNESGNSSGQSYSTKGIKAESEINISGFTINISSTDDGINACTGDGKTSPVVNVTAGYIDITTASGDTDGIDSNGNYVQSGGFVLVKGGSSSGNVSGSIDVDGTVTITGGTCVALGGVCETPINSANAYVLSSVSFSSGSYSLKDASGNEVISFTFDGLFSNGWICSDTLTTGTSYTLYRGSDSIADWTQEAGTMGVSGTGGFGGGKMGGQNGSFGGGRR